jgi:PAS domain S-box-containing protein
VDTAAEVLARRGFDALFYGHPDGIVVFDLGGRFVECNDSLVTLTGYNRDELVAMTFGPIVRTGYERMTWENFSEAAKGRATRYVTKGMTKTGDCFVVDVTNIPLRDEGGEVVAVLGIARDIGNLQEAVAQADRGQTVLRIAGRIARFAGWAIDVETGELSWSDELYAMLGVAPGAIPTHEAALTMYEPPHREVVRAAFDRCMSTGEPIDLTVVIKDADGRRLNARILGEAERDSSGAIVRLNGAFHDVSDVVESRRELADRAELLDAARDAIVVRDLDGSIRYWNRSAAQLYGWSREEVTGRSVRDLVYADPAAFDRANAAVRERGYWIGELHQQTRDGRTIVVECRWQVMTDEEGTPTSIFTVNTDITEQKRQQELEFRTQRLESLGTLAGGIAHDLNNTLAPILLAIQMLKSTDQDERATRLLASAELAAQRGADMVRQVLSFARGVEGEWGPVALGDLLDEFAMFCVDTMPKSIDVRLDRPADLGLVLGDSTQLLQVFVNLVTNARDSMQDGGVLTIRAREIADRSQVSIEIEDTGHGMDTAIAAKIFDPFFTTKEVGHGTGLGLSTSLAIVQSHGGTIELRTEPGRGTVVDVRLPAVEPEARCD